MSRYKTDILKHPAEHPLNSRDRQKTLTFIINFIILLLLFCNVSIPKNSSALRELIKLEAKIKLRSMNTRLSRRGHSDKHKKIHFSVDNRALGLSQGCALRARHEEFHPKLTERGTGTQDTSGALRHPSLPLEKQPKPFI